MSVHAVTARSHKKPKLNFVFPLAPAVLVPLRTIRPVRTRIPAAISLRKAASPVAKLALKKLALRLLGPLAIASPVVGDILWMQYQKYIAPQGFPGFDAIDAQFYPDAQGVYPGIEPGDYIANGFGGFPEHTDTYHLLTDLLDGTPIFGFRYWGHYLPETTFPGPATDWPVKTQVQAMPGPQALPKPALRPHYKRLRDLSPMLQASPQLGNISIKIPPTGEDVIFEFDVPSIRDRGTKAKPANQFVYMVLRKLLDAGGETKELIDMFADASDYHPDSKIIPKSLQGKEMQKKVWWLFFAGGINHVDFAELAIAVRFNESEDAIFGGAGQLSKSAAQHLGLTVGVQTGLVL